MNTDKNRRILIIDDNRSIHDDFRKILSPSETTLFALDTAEAALFGSSPSAIKQIQFELDSAYQGQEGITLVKKALDEGRPFAMAFVDIRMPPGLDGVETTQKIWEIDPAIQIVICTAYSDYSWSEMYEKVGQRDGLLILKKPFDNVEALQLAHTLTEKWRLNQESHRKLEDLEGRVAERTKQIKESELSLLNMMEDTVRSREKVEQAYEKLKLEVAERAKLEQQFRQAQKMEAVGQLAGGVAHDFNNLLTIMGGSVEMLLWEEPNLAAQSKAYLADIAAAASRATGLTRQLLTFSRQQAMKMQPIDLNDTIASFTKMLRRIVGEDIKVQSNFASGLPLIQADTGMIEQIVMNLVVNARDAMPKGGTLTVTTSAETVDETRAKEYSAARPGQFVCLSVRDTGEGIAPENLKRIFEPFFTTKGVGKGTGLGLATVFGIVEQHHGWIELKSELGHGTTFRILLPVAAGALLSTDEKAAEKACRGTEKILLVEDEQGVRDLTKRALEHHGYTVFTADSGPAAQKTWAEHSHEIDLLFTDMVMPGGVTGLELAEMLQKQKPALKVILASGYSTTLAGTDLGAKAFSFLQKPFAPRIAAETVRACLDAR